MNVEFTCSDCMTAPTCPPNCDDELPPRSALFRGRLNQDAFFRLFHELSKESPVWISQDLLHWPNLERLGGVTIEGKYYHVYREAA